MLKHNGTMKRLLVWAAALALLLSCTGGWAAAETEAPREFEYFCPLVEPYQEQNPIFDELQKRTGIKINFTYVSSDAFSTLLTSRIADGNLPDVIGRLSPGALSQQLINEGLIVPLTELLPEKMPNYMRFVTDEDYQYLLNADGEVYCFGYKINTPGQASWMIRQDWLDKLNMKTPETWDEWVETWRAFRDNDLNGNGVADEIPLLVQYSYFYYYLNMYGIRSGGTYSIIDGHVVYDCEHPLYMEWMDAMRGLYAEGLIPQDFITIDATARKQLLGSNRVGSICFDAVAASEFGQLLSEIDKDALLACVSPVQSPYGERAIRARKGIIANTWITKAALEAGKLDAILEYFNYVFSDEGIFLTNYGFEGETYEMVDGKAKLMDPYGSDFSAARHYGLISEEMPFLFPEDNFLSIMFKGKSDADMDIYSQQAKLGLGPVNEGAYYAIPPTITTEASVEYADLVDEQKALRDTYIMGQISLEEYQQEYEALKEAGLIEVMEAADAAYQSMMAGMNK